jgi:FimV-like protein
MQRIQEDTLEFDQAVGLVTGQARIFAAELISEGSRGIAKGMDALQYDLAVAHLEILRRRELLPAADVEGATLSALMREVSEQPAAELAFADMLRADDLEVAALLEDTQPNRVLDVDMIEIETKLDLARSYMDAGDPEGARSILEEVIEVETDAKDKILELARVIEKTRT